MYTYYLHLGSNEGNRLGFLKAATEAIESNIGKIKDSSSVYETEPWGKTDQEQFLNQALGVISDKSPMEVLNIIQNIKTQMGQSEKEKWGPRKIDIDILYCDDLIVDENDLKLPHPHLYERNFVLIPLMEIAGDFIDPVKNSSIEEIFDACNDVSEVLFYEE